MSSWFLVKEIRVEDVDGYLPLLRDMIWRANFTYQLEYAIYRRDRGTWMEEYRVMINIIAKQVMGSVPYCFQACGTSEAMVVQEVARVSTINLRHELTELS